VSNLSGKQIEDARQAIAYVKERDAQIDMLYDLVDAALDTGKQTTADQWWFFAKMVQSGLAEMRELSRPTLDYLEPLAKTEGGAA